MFQDILVIRHGETEWNVEHRMQGRLDSPLTPRGLEQAHAIRTVIRGIDLDGWDVYSSPQPRALHTAAIAFSGSEHHVLTDPRLREIDVGDWAGLNRSEIIRRAGASEASAGFLDHYDRSPGENFADLRDRCTRFLKSLQRPAVVVTHGITSRMLRVVALGLETRSISHVEGGQGIVHGVIDGKAACYGQPSMSGDQT